MKIFLRVAGVLVLLLSLLGAVGCGVGIFYIWRFHQSAPPEAQRIAAQIETRLERALIAMQQVQRGLEQARVSVAAVNRESGNLKSGSDIKRRATSSAIRKLVLQQVDPNVNDLGNRLIILSDTATAISSLLQTFRELPESHTGRISSDQLEGWSDQATRLSSALRRLDGMVEDPNRESSDQDLAAASRAVADALQSCQVKIDGWKVVLESAHQDFQQVRSLTSRWFTPAAMILTVVCVWLALGQLSLCLHALQWCMVQSNSSQRVLVKD